MINANKPTFVQEFSEVSNEHHSEWDANDGEAHTEQATAVGTGFNRIVACVHSHTTNS